MSDQAVVRKRTVTFKGEISGNTPKANPASATSHAGHGSHGMPPVQLYLDGKVFDLNRIDQHVVAGTTEEWTLVNEDVFQHPFHIHVNPFQVIEINGQPVHDDTWWDVIALPSKGQMTVRMYFRPDVTGKTVYHCHILPHEDNGMMAKMRVQLIRLGWSLQVQLPGNPAIIWGFVSDLTSCDLAYHHGKTYGIGWALLAFWSFRHRQASQHVGGSTLSPYQS
jgi:hypothetical protein